MAVVDELRAEYGDRLEFEVVSPERTAAAGEELARFNLTSRGHGLVAFDAAGEVVMTLAGHAYGREEIELAVGQVVDT